MPTVAAAATAHLSLNQQDNNNINTGATTMERKLAPERATFAFGAKVLEFWAAAYLCLGSKRFGTKKLVFLY